MRYFYYYFRPWVLILKILGIFPLDNILSADPKKLKVKRFGMSVVYSTVIFATCIAILVIYSGAAFHVETVNEKSLQAVVLFSSARSIICLLAFSRDCKKLPSLINILNIYDQKKEELNFGKRRSFWYNIFVWTVLPIFLSFLLAAIYTFLSACITMGIFSPDIRYGRKGFFAALALGFLSIWHTFPLSLYIYFSAKIIHNFSELNESLIQENIVGNYLELPKKLMNLEIISKYKYLHNMLSQCVYHLEYAYGTALAVDQICVMGILIVNFAVYIWLYLLADNWALLAITAVSILLALTVLLTSQRIKEEGNEIVNILHRMPTKSISDECLKELQTFMIQIHVRPVEISASGYFTLDKRQILNIITQVSTYLIVVCQLVQSYYQYNNQQNSNSTHIVNTDVN
ncbi:uncharacterized protein LOC126880034 isoform X3 [Diabrotica virgifera virgifera]|uniref:Gustatory receptor n=1 Tax=Diabrotica virgifera virgifera TaxID=50390 RepID=A0ABM5JNR2_DIAVI|nr:uncharacterized protein LOC126880034 isoform X3 [Diabrotica virgifera virgifera]